MFIMSFKQLQKVTTMELWTSYGRQIPEKINENATVKYGNFDNFSMNFRIIF